MLRLLLSLVLALGLLPNVSVAQGPGALSEVRDPTVLADDLLARHGSNPKLASPELIRRTMLRLIGPLPERTPLNPRVMGETSLPGMRIQKILFDSQPGFHVTALLYLPEATLLPGGSPAIVMAPGHSPAGKAGDFSLAAAFVRNGFAVLSYDPIGQGERLQYPDPDHLDAPAKSLAERPTGEHAETSLQPELIGDAIAQYFLWDGMRAIDYLESRPEIDRNRIGAFGCSGGGAMTALLGAVDPRLKAIGTACYITTFHALLGGIGPQDAEQSTPGWIAEGLDFSNYIEAAAPRPYAEIATEGDMFPFAGAQASEREAQAFYGRMGAESKLAFIYGPGGHGNLKPILPQILKFFIDALQPAPFPPVYDAASPAMQPPPGALQVTPSGQVATFDPAGETVYSLNLTRAAGRQMGHPETRQQLRARILKVTGEAGALGPRRFADEGLKAYAGPALPATDGLRLGTREVLSEPVKLDTYTRWKVALPRRDGSVLHGTLVVPAGAVPAGASAPAVHLLLSSPASAAADTAKLTTLAEHGALVLQVFPEPNDPASLSANKKVDLKAGLLGPWYLPALRFWLVGRTLLGERMEDVLEAVDYLEQLRVPHAAGLRAEAGGHLGLVLLHAAALDGRITETVLAQTPETYAHVLRVPVPRDIIEDLLPGVLLQYDVPDLMRAAKVGAQPR